MQGIDPGVEFSTASLALGASATPKNAFTFTLYGGAHICTKVRNVLSLKEFRVVVYGLRPSRELFALLSVVSWCVLIVRDT